MARLRVPRFSIVVAVGVGLGVGACGSGGLPPSPGNGVASKSPGAIIAAAQVALSGLRSVHVSGTLGTETVNMYFVAGKGSGGSIAIKRLSFDFIDVDGVSYIKGAAFSREVASLSALNGHHNATAVNRLLKGRWLKLPAHASNGLSGGFPTTTHALLSELLAGIGTLTKRGSTTVDGLKCVAVSGGARTIYVATTGKTYPLEIAASGTQSGSHIVFDDFNAPISVDAPAHTIDVASLEK